MMVPLWSLSRSVLIVNVYVLIDEWILGNGKIFTFKISRLNQVFQSDLVELERLQSRFVVFTVSNCTERNQLHYLYTHSYEHFRYLV